MHYAENFFLLGVTQHHSNWLSCDATCSLEWQRGTKYYNKSKKNIQTLVGMYWGNKIMVILLSIDKREDKFYAVPVCHSEKIE
jgi:hypothetical protein